MRKGGILIAELKESKPVLYYPALSVYRVRITRRNVIAEIAERLNLMMSWPISNV